MRRTTILLAAACLALTGCSSSSDSGDKPQPTVTKTVTASPSLSEAEARQACIDGWMAVMNESPGKEAEWEDRPAVCGGLQDQMDMYVEAAQERAAANRERIDACVEDPSCTSVPIG